MLCKTVIIKTKNGLVTINESDFDEKKQKLATAAEVKKSQEPAKEETGK